MMDDIKRKMAKHCLDEMLENKDPYIYKDLARAAHNIALSMVMQWLDNRRISHCKECPSTDQLLAFNGYYYCHGHLPVEKNGKVEIIAGVNGHAA